MLQHPPKIADLLKAAQGFWPRFKLRLRMVLLGHTWRAWRADDILAVVSLVVFSHFFFILVATTTFISLLLMVINSLPFQDFISRLVAQYISDITWTDMTFESGILPQWREGVIRLNNVTVRRTFESEKRHWESWRRKTHESDRKSSPDGTQTSDPVPGSEYDEETGLTRSEKNFMVFEVLIGEMDLTLSLWRALEGKGLIKDCALKDVRGVVDRRHVDFSGIPWSADASRAGNVPGFFEMDRFTIQDLLVTIYQPNFRPYSVSIFNMETPQLRWEWFLFDLLDADSIVGMFDNCLFSLRKRKFGNGISELPRNSTFGSRGIAENWTVEDEELLARSEEGSVLIHCRVDNVPIDHLNNNTIGPFGWITSGKLDIDCKMLVPSSFHSNSILGVVAHEAKDLIDRIQDHHDNNDDGARLYPAAQSTITDPVLGDIKATIDGELPVPLHSNSDSHSTRSLATRIEESVDELFMSNPLWRKMHQHNMRAKSSQRTLSDGTNSTPRLVNGQSVPTTANNPNQLSPPLIVQSPAGEKDVKFFFNVKMNNLKAAVPLATPEIGYLQGTMVRPVVAYMNAHRTLVPLQFSFGIPLSHFHGAWTAYDAFIYDKFADGLGKCVVSLMQDDRERAKRIRRVGMWSLRSVAKNVRDLYDSLRGSSSWVQFVPSQPPAFYEEPLPV
ncbi:mitochondrial distribution and morphology protein family 31/32 [Gonapodya prolifera JEL478]|uniref:Mitochondrial distribution and morphology protein family 31/32 n=1 Tax=Gonapodya prolifera (strain JEL478) TaxID=1344416 RepID=A0A139AZZ6_GONPJ|nr:mitochondrial distribution and morphology protein family 31/32 [Gonapodya prolifera JEL478]|eukprot:KXS22311.1 mitochondrial distribution and morphology protein family 31/32 [Gonapodya prolifera JEL478]